MSMMKCKCDKIYDTDFEYEVNGEGDCICDSCYEKISCADCGLLKEKCEHVCRISPNTNECLICGTHYNSSEPAQSKQVEQTLQQEVDDLVMHPSIDYARGFIDVANDIINLVRSHHPKDSITIDRSHTEAWLNVYRLSNTMEAKLSALEEIVRDIKGELR